MIVAVEAIALRAGGRDTAGQDPSGEVVVLRVETDDGRVGLAECNHHPAAVLAYLNGDGRTSVELGVRPVVVGREPEEREAIMRDLGVTNYFSGRRGLGLALLHAIDVCLWDLVAQGRGEPLWRTLWGDRARAPEAYATLYTGAAHSRLESERRLAALAEASLPLGYRALKVEPLPEVVAEDDIVAFVDAGRQLAGNDRELFVDFGHRLHDAEHASAVIDTLAHDRPALIETPLPVDDVAEYAWLAARTAVPIAASELYESVWEYLVLLDVGRVHVVQPWPNRLGITETLRVAAAARERGRRCILAGWNATPIGVAVGMHIAAGLGSGVVLEHAPQQAYGFPLRPIAGPEPRVVDGRLQLPDTPGLGVALDEEAVARFRMA